MAVPKIIVAEADHVRLTQLANGLLERRPELVESLLTELERARVVRNGATKGTVQMGSIVDYQIEGGLRRQVQLVYPIEADIERGKVSILTPIGSALLGLAAGQTIGFSSNDGRKQRLKVLSVEQ